MSSLIIFIPVYICNSARGSIFFITENIPFIINSAWRSADHNEKVGGKPDSSHLKGLAVDIKVTNSRQRFIILQSLIAAGFNRIGIAKTFIHVDGDNEKDPRVTWLY